MGAEACNGRPSLFAKACELSPKPPMSSSSMLPKTPKGLFPPKNALKISSASAKETPHVTDPATLLGDKRS